MMRRIVKIALGISSLLLSSCSADKKSNDEVIVGRAARIVEYFDSAGFDMLNTWSYNKRGKSDVWSKNSGDSILYHCTYLNMEDENSEKIYIKGDLDDFRKDFPTAIPIDSSFHKLVFSRLQSGLISVDGVDGKGNEILLYGKTSQTSIFPFKEPFKKFEELAKLQKSMKFYRFHRFERLGGIIQINLSPSDVLTYVPNLDSIEQPYKEVWESRFSKGKWIDKRWNLWKLGKPADNG